MEFQLIVALMFRLECVSNDVLTIFIFHPQSITPNYEQENIWLHHAAVQFSSIFSFYALQSEYEQHVMLYIYISILIKYNMGTNIFIKK